MDGLRVLKISRGESLHYRWLGFGDFRFVVICNINFMKRWILAKNCFNGLWKGFNQNPIAKRPLYLSCRGVTLVNSYDLVTVAEE